MEGIFLLVGLGVLAIPAIAIGAWIRASNLRELVEDKSRENQRDVSDLKREIATLRRSLEVVNEKLAATANRPAEAPGGVISPMAAAAKTAETAKTAATVKATPNLAFAHSIPIEQAPHIAPPPPSIHHQQEAPVQPPPAIQAAAPIIASATTEAPPAPVTIPQPPPPTPVSPNTAPAASAAKASTTANVPAPRLPLRTPQPLPKPRPSSFTTYPAAEPRVSFVDWLRTRLPLEEVLGMNLFAKIGIVLLVLGFALLGRVALISMGPAGKVALLYAAAGVLLGGGIWLERKERYGLIGRTGIGGGWALAFFTTYAMNHVQAMKMMSSETLNCVLLLLVAIAIAAHTLRYKSQLVTGLAFLLAFSTVALTQDTVYALSAGVILAVGIVAVALRMGWYELEVFGVLASFSNHFYWLYKFYPNGVAGHAFPQLVPSSIILVLYWLIFRVSYVVRNIRTPRDERISTIAALTNTILLLSVMKFQSTRPELAAYALLALGAMEFIFGQLPVTRRRRPAFLLLTVLGTMLIFAAVPFKFSGNSIAVVWMIGAEALLIAGIAQKEVVFRRLGLIAGTLTGLLVAYETRTLFELRQHAQTPLIASGIQLLLCAALFYANAHFVRERWREMFQGIDEQLAEWQSYLGAAMAFVGVWALFPRDGTAVGWALLMIGAALGTRLLDNRHLLAQTWIFSAAVAIRMAVVSCHVTDVYPHHVTARLTTLPLLALIFYLTAAVISSEQGQELRIYLRSFTLLAGTSALVALVWLEVSPDWVAYGWLGLTVGLYLTSRIIKLDDLCWQGHVLAGLVTADLLLSNPDTKTALARYLPIVLSAVAFYAVSRFCTLQSATYKRAAAWAHTSVATGLLATLAWREAQQPWLAVLWIAFALTLALVDRFFDVEELPWQAHALAALAVIRAATVNLYVLEKWHGIDLRLVTLSILIAALYALAYCVRLPQTAKDDGLNHIYSWAGSIFGAWMLWSELQPIAVADGLAVFGLLLFEFGDWRKLRQIRLQGYVALTIGFARIFFVNLTAATLPGETISPRSYTVVPIALINLFVWMQLQSGKENDEVERFSIANLLAWFATGSVASLLYFQVSSEWIVLSWAILAVVLLLTVLTIDKELFLQQALLLVTAVVTRGIAHNIFGSSYFSVGGWKGNFAVLTFVVALLLATLPAAFRLRTRYIARPLQFRLSQALALNRPEQWLFFAPILLLTLMIVVKLNAGMVTLAWGLEGLLVVLLGLRVGERSYRITGLLLLLICVCKIVFRDAWQLSERDRYITFIALGAALMLVSTLYNRFRQSIRRLL